MAEFKIRTKNNDSPKGKPRVYFTCHPEDLSACLDRVCKDIFLTHDCAIYYTEDMTAPLDEETLNADLGQMNLVVVPISYKLLREKNRAMQVDIAYAKENNIPILPLMMESGIDTLYSMEENFGERQYLTPEVKGTSSESYKGKLKNYLDTILVSGEMADRIRAAFDAYVFLSYRKKDRKYADELMRIIHAIPGCRDIAIWYDEFLTPGESFVSNIESAMDNSRLFALLVTPNILEEDNYVLREEYPAARRKGMDILPTEMVNTDRERLFALFDGIPSPIMTEDKEFSASFIGMLEKIAKSENDNDPEHNFLIGLAYLDGIDMEVDRPRALQLIENSANEGLPEAMEKMYHIYHDGIRTLSNNKLASYWASKLLDYSKAKNGTRHKDTLLWSYRAAHCLRLAKEKDAALEVSKDSYDLHRQVYGRTDERTMMALSELSLAYTLNKDFKKACKIGRKACRLDRRIYGKSHEITLRAYSDLCYCYHKAFKFKPAIKYGAMAYKGFCELFGEAHPETLTLLANLAQICHQTLHIDDEIELLNKVLEGRIKTLGADNPDTVETVGSMGICYKILGDYEEAIRCYRFALKKQAAIFGENHNETRMTAKRLLEVLRRIGRTEEAKKITDKYFKED